jgi:hypothetical protein
MRSVIVSAETEQRQKGVAGWVEEHSDVLVWLVAARRRSQDVAIEGQGGIRVGVREDSRGW